MRPWFAACGVVLLGLGWGLWLQRGPRELDGAVRALLDGDLDGAERRAALRVVHDRGLARASERPDAAVLAAMAALEMEDRSGYDRAVEAGDGVLLGGAAGTAETPTDAVLRRFALGAPYLESLLRGRLARASGREAEAATWLLRAERSARMYQATAALELVRDERAGLAPR